MQSNSYLSTATHILPNTQCPMPNAPCPMPNAQCPMPNAFYLAGKLLD
ncbi:MULTISPECIES: hypothetical protein [Nostoc]|uniref:Histidine kinase n=1 Tax=Nostoc paludosum FACHB-159 TaxID=2692908 RepID=A0ABR8KBI1_9NOSO|nr:MULTISPECIES: hypothetical protein [Nostoc]MBD2679810.1 hypothetical protein [Nostoc sp. FACHB-857]MBD2736059.1 hypothetical protein [Nostoc paludosum FACHB-159]